MDSNVAVDEDASLLALLFETSKRTLRFGLFFTIPLAFIRAARVLSRNSPEGSDEATDAWLFETAPCFRPRAASAEVALFELELDALDLEEDDSDEFAGDA